MAVKMTNETKTGLFVLVCLMVLAGLLIKVGSVAFFKRGYIVRSHFHFTGGVKRNAPVRLSGVDVGEVKNIRVQYGDDTVVEVDLWLENGTKIRKDSRAYVTTLGLMGEKYVEIKAGSASSGDAEPGDLVAGDDPVRLEELMEIGTRVAKDIGQMAKDISRVADHADHALQDNRSKIDHIFDNLEETSQNFNEFSQDIKHHPWKILIKGKEVPKDTLDGERRDRPHHKSKKNFGPAQTEN